MTASSPEGSAEPGSAEPRPAVAPRQVLVGLVSGAACGVFFGDHCAPLGHLGAAFVTLLQMTVIPYLFVAILLRLGSLPRAMLLRLGKVAVGTTVALIAIGCALITVLGQTFPAREGGRYFSPTLATRPEPVSLFDQLLTANPFEAFANGVVPAVVLFSLACGVAMSAVPHPDPLLRILEISESILLRVNKAILRFTPLGVFVITAATAGTIELRDASRIQAWLIVQIVYAVLLVAGILPLVIVALTPLPWRRVIHESRAIVITAFATGKVIAVLPLIIDTADRLLREHSTTDDLAEGTVEAVVPLVYSVPHLGRLSSLMFIPFAAWFVGDAIPFRELPQFFLSGTLALFGTPVSAVPWLLDARQLPADMFELFIGSSVICGPLADAVGAMHLFTVALLVPTLIGGRPAVAMSRSGAALLSAVALTLLAAPATHGILVAVLPASDAPQTTHAQKSSPLTLRPGTVRDAPPDTSASPQGDESRVDRIQSREVLRVGYHADNLPFSYRNSAGQLVGFDVDMGRLLAEDLGVAVEFVPFEFATLSDQLNRGDFDVAMSGIALTPSRMLRVNVTEPYIDSTLAFVVRDHRRQEFQSAETVAGLRELTLAVPAALNIESRLRRALPEARMMRLESPREFFESQAADALVISAEAGSAWTIEYPAYSVAVPYPEIIAWPLVYAVPKTDQRMATLVSHWLSIVRDTRNYGILFDHWILGKSPRRSGRRWSIARDVLHWLP